jgi:hypothetical protein
VPTLSLIQSWNVGTANARIVVVCGSTNPQTFQFSSCWEIVYLGLDVRGNHLLEVHLCLFQTNGNSSIILWQSGLLTAFMRYVESSHIFCIDWVVQHEVCWVTLCNCTGKLRNTNSWHFVDILIYHQSIIEIENRKVVLRWTVDHLYSNSVFSSENNAWNNKYGLGNQP